MKKTKPVPATTVNVLLGRGDNPIRSVEEQNKKTEEDARACGRIPRNILNPDTLKSCPTIVSKSSDGEETGRKSPPAPQQVPSTSPSLLPVDVAIGKTLNKELWHRGPCCEVGIVDGFRFDTGEPPWFNVQCIVPILGIPLE